MVNNYFVFLPESPEKSQTEEERLNVEWVESLMTDVERNRREAYGEGPIRATRRSRVLPFRGPDGEPLYTLIQEWFGTNGEVERDARFCMCEAEFLALKNSCNTANERLPN